MTTQISNPLPCRSPAPLLLLQILIMGSLMPLTAAAQSGTWKRHAIDSSFRGADGVRLGDFDGDGLPDVVTGWEESGIVRLYLNPGHDRVTDPWPVSTVGKAKSPEDAVPMDIDGDGDLDVISCHEGKQRQILIHRFIGDETSPEALLTRGNWKSKPLSAADGQMWMFAAPIQLEKESLSFVAGSKGGGATITLFVRAKKRSLPALSNESVGSDELVKWSAIKLRRAGWIMSLRIVDMDGDGDEDVLFSDRKGDNRGIGWLEQPDRPQADNWPEHRVGGDDSEVLFIHGGASRILATTRNNGWMEFLKQAAGDWKRHDHQNPTDVPLGKAIAPMAGKTLVLTANTAADRIKTQMPGIWIKQTGQQDWQALDNETETKYDRIECLDLDGDGDLDVMTCEERKNLGVIWYENPASSN